jgi:hypothetical protein
MNRRFQFACGMILGGALAVSPAFAQPASNLPGTVILEVRTRYETASQTGVADADALTARTRLGWQSDIWRDLQGAIEFDNVANLSGESNDGVPPAEPYATIADPEGSELNRLQLAWTPHADFTATIGRQRIVLDDQRFIGASAWRQDDQTFDALRLDAKHGALQFTYAYLGHINRIFADELDWDSQSHIASGSYAFGAPLKLAAFAYLLDFDAAGAASSNATYGVRASGALTARGVAFSYSGSYAQQTDYGANPNAYEAEYWALDLSAAYGPVTGRVGFESLEGEGPGRRFQTPLATLHLFQGWADVFLSTPNDGLEDLFVSAIYRPAIATDHFSNSALTLTWHAFDAERTGADLGEEIDVQFTGAITPQLGFVLKYADYDGAGAPADTTRAWFGLEFKL